MPSLYRLIRPLFFILNPETAHGLSLFALKLISPILSAKTPQYDNLKNNVFGLSFDNPLGLAAGYDKDAEAPQALLKLGFSFVEVGTLTPKPQIGNAKPRLFRLIEDHAVINRFGFNNSGQQAAIKRLDKFKKTHVKGILGINIGANKDSANKLADYLHGVENMAHLADYLVINISSPNTPGLRNLQTIENLETLLKGIAPILANQEHRPPVLVKVAPDLGVEDVAPIAKVIKAMSVDGLIVSNTSVSRPHHLKSPQRDEAGGLSGAPLFDLSTKMLKYFYAELGDNVPIIGVGGISNADQAYEKIRAGASLIQLYSALVYEGPSLIHSILSGLSHRLEADGFKNIRDAIGADV